MGCTLCNRSDGFCATPGRLGNIRTGSKIFCAPQMREAFGNVVLMGMGEPFHNYENVMTAIRGSLPNWALERATSP